MSVRSFDATCLLAFAIGIGVIFVAYGPMGFFSRWLGTRSHIDARTAKEEGVPVWITGTFERLLAFFLVLLKVLTRSSPFGLARNSLRVGTVYPPSRTGTPKATMSNESITDRLGMAPYVRSSQALSQS
jgi:hypothetical protein